MISLASSWSHRTDGPTIDDPESKGIVRFSELGAGKQTPPTFLWREPWSKIIYNSCPIPHFRLTFHSAMSQQWTSMRLQTFPIWLQSIYSTTTSVPFHQGLWITAINWGNMRHQLNFGHETCNNCVSFLDIWTWEITTTWKTIPLTCGTSVTNTSTANWKF